MPDTVVTFNGSTVGLIVRGKSGPAHHPGVMEQHADCILSDGSPMGFFGEPVNGTPKGAASSGVMSGGSSGAGTTAFSSFSPWGSVPGSIIGGLVGSNANSVGMAMKGEVYDYGELRMKRLHYVDLGTAAAYKVVSTVLLVPVNAKQAADFDKYWRDLDNSPGSFNLLGGNCSTHASDGFITAKLVSGGIPGLDTPDHLYEQLAAAFPAATTMSGYVGFTANSTGKGYTMTVRT